VALCGGGGGNGGAAASPMHYQGVIPWWYLREDATSVMAYTPREVPQRLTGCAAGLQAIPAPECDYQ